MAQCDDINNSTGRRQFLKSLFGLGGFPLARQADAGGIAGSFVWADLKTGQIGFPTGTAVAPGLPGSLMKLIAAAAIRDANLFPANETFECRGAVVLNHCRYNCQTAHGRVDLIQAIGHSCNVFFAQASQKLSTHLFLDYAQRFGLNQAVAGLASGPFPEAAQDDSVQFVLGLKESLEPHAIQVMQMSALIATRGQPPALHRAEEPHSAGNPIKLRLSDGTWDTLEQGMQLAGRLGTARSLDPDNKLRLAVKTGTAPHGKTFQSWLTGYFPVGSPRYAFCARAYAGTSQTAAIPLAHKYLFSVEWP